MAERTLAADEEYNEITTRTTSLLKEDDLIFEVPDDVATPSEEHKHTLISTAITRREYGLIILYNMLQRWWRPPRGIEVSSFGQAIYIVKFELGCNYNNVILRSPWGLNEDILIMEVLT